MKITKLDPNAAEIYRIKLYWNNRDLSGYEIFSRLLVKSHQIDDAK